MEGGAPSSSGKVEARWRMAEELAEMGGNVADEYENVISGYVLITKQKMTEVRFFGLSYLISID